MSEDTPATSTDPALGTEGDSNQLGGEDTMSGADQDQLLDEGISPPDEPRKNHFGETHWEESHGEPHDLRLAQEEPEVWEAPDPENPDGPDTERSGELAADSIALDGQDNDVFADEQGVPGGQVGAEDAAMHIISEPTD